jgi:deoxyribodipyrimidine photolyase-related protein
MNTDPTVYKPQASSSIQENIQQVAKYVESKYPKNPGVLHLHGKSESDLVSRISMYPITNADAKKRLTIFLTKMLPDFGKYEDAFQPGVSFGYHSVLSSSLNNGLLTPAEILEAIQSLPGKTTRKHLASLEGFVRQVFGWRSYCRLVYRQERQVMMRSNFLGHTRRLPGTWFRYPKEGESLTNIEWLDNLLLDAQERAYAHHIVRLMVFSNWFLLNQYHPQDVLKWFWSVVSIDAYEWVMVPNVLGMGQYADGGIMMTRPYISAGAYLETMSGGKVNDEDGIWTALYYGFLMKHDKTIGKMYAYARSMAYIRRSPSNKQSEWKATVKRYWKSLGKKYSDKSGDESGDELMTQ